MKIIEDLEKLIKATEVIVKIAATDQYKIDEAKQKALRAGTEESH